jgi:hypothetical protein
MLRYIPTKCRRPFQISGTKAAGIARIPNGSIAPFIFFLLFLDLIC